MKTSTKLFIIFLISIPVSLVVFNMMLKNELIAGNLTQVQYYNSDFNYIEKKLPPFKYLVIDGAMVSGDTTNNKRYKRDADWQPKIQISLIADSITKTSRFRYLRNYADFLRTRVHNDTLFISFYKKVIADRFNSYGDNYVNDLIKINAPNTKLVSVRSALVNLDNMKASSPVDSLALISAGKNTFKINYLNVNRLNVEIKNSAKVVINENNNHINSLYYSMLNNGHLQVEANTVKHFYPGKADSLARISLSGNANDLKKMLK